MDFELSYAFCLEQIRYCNEHIASLTAQIDKDDIKREHELKNRKKRIRKLEYTIKFAKKNFNPNLPYIKELNTKLVLLEEEYMDIYTKYNDLYVKVFRKREEWYSRRLDFLMREASIRESRSWG